MSDQRRKRIEDLRNRKGYLLSPDMLKDTSDLKYSVLVQGDPDTYVYKGVPETSRRQLSSDISEFAGPIAIQPQNNGENLHE